MENEDSPFAETLAQRKAVSWRNQRGSTESPLTLEREKAGYKTWKEGKEALDKLRLGKGATVQRHLWLCAEREE